MLILSADNQLDMIAKPSFVRPELGYDPAP